MSIFEFIGESYNPGPVGDVEIKRKPDPPRNNNVLLHFLISLLALAGIEYYYMNSNYGSLMSLDFWIFHGILLIYLTIAYYLKITPNTSNMGWVPFIIDNPFRYSDDINRFGLIMKILLLPGQYVLGSIIAYYQYQKTKQIDN